MKKILIVEDQAHNMRLFEQILEDYDDTMILVKALTGAEALEMARGQDLDLILMDIALPDTDGIQVTKKLKQDPMFKNTPVIAVTAHASVSEEEVLRQIFNDYLSKPIDEDRLIEKIKKWIGEK